LKDTSIINVSQCSAPALDLSINAAKNQINSSGFSYDNAGNMTGDGSYSYVWNGAGLLKSAGGVTYTYDGNGERVEKSGGTLYWRGLDGNVLAETDTSGNTLDEYVYFDGSRIARRDASGNVYYYFPDTLGSEVSITNATGTPCFDADFYLFGGEKVFTNNCPPSYKFAGMERDSETGLDHTLNRQYSSQYGRWLSPDPMGGDIMNPQSLNRYAYVLNNPTSLTDPLGLFSGNPADFCSDPSDPNYGGARCQGPPGCSWLGDPNCCAGPDIGGDNAELCDPMIGNFPPLNPWNPLPAITPPTAADQLGALGIGGSCGPLGCSSPRFQNFYQSGEGVRGLYELVKAVCKEDPTLCIHMLKDIVEIAKEYGPGLVRLTKTAANKAANSALCPTAPPGYGPCPKGPSQIPQWPPTPTNKIIPVPTPAKDVPIVSQPKVPPGPGISPNPGKIIPVH